MLVRRPVWDALGGFDKRFPLNVRRHLTFCLKARAAGYEVTQCDTISLLHRESSTRGAAPPTPTDYERFAALHGEFLREQGVVLDAPAAIRHLARVAPDISAIPFDDVLGD